MRRCAKAKESHALTTVDFRHPQTAEADDPGAQQRCGMQVVQSFRQRKDKIIPGHGIFRIAAIDHVAGEFQCIAEVLTAVPAIPAVAVRSCDPGNTDTSSEG
jgi:hypothetical protein